jgi:hypothetical protein
MENWKSDFLMMILDEEKQQHRIRGAEETFGVVRAKACILGHRPDWQEIRALSSKLPSAQ